MHLLYSMQRPWVNFLSQKVYGLLHSSGVGGFGGGTFLQFLSLLYFSFDPGSLWILPLQYQYVSPQSWPTGSDMPLGVGDVYGPPLILLTASLFRACVPCASLLFVKQVSKSACALSPVSSSPPHLYMGELPQCSTGPLWVVPRSHCLF